MEQTTPAIIPDPPATPDVDPCPGMSIAEVMQTGNLDLVGRVRAFRDTHPAPAPAPEPDPAT